MKYTFSDEEEEEDGSDALSVRRSGRNGRDTPAVASGPTVTASGRQVRSRATGLYGESLLSGQATERASPATGEYERSDASGEQPPTNGRATRGVNSSSNGWRRGRTHIETYNSVDEMDDEDDATTSGGEWDAGDEDEAADQMDVDEDENDFEDDDEPKTLVVHLRYPKGSFNPTIAAPAVEEHVTPAVTEQPGLGAHRSLQPAPPLPAQLAAPPPQAVTSTITNGIQVPQERTVVVSTPQEPSPPGDAHVQPKAWPLFTATPPYSAPGDPVPKSQFPDTHSPVPITATTQ